MNIYRNLPTKSKIDTCLRTCKPLNHPLEWIEKGQPLPLVASSFQPNASKAQDDDLNKE